MKIQFKNDMIVIIVKRLSNNTIPLRQQRNLAETAEALHERSIYVVKSAELTLCGFYRFFFFSFFLQSRFTNDWEKLEKRNLIYEITGDKEIIN